MDIFKKIFNKKTLGLFGASLLLSAFSMVFDDTRDGIRDQEMIDETAEEIIKKLKKEGYISKKDKDK